jgi:hypothetical protein
MVRRQLAGHPHIRMLTRKGTPPLRPIVAFSSPSPPKLRRSNITRPKLARGVVGPLSGMRPRFALVLSPMPIASSRYESKARKRRRGSADDTVGQEPGLLVIADPGLGEKFFTAARIRLAGRQPARRIRSQSRSCWFSPFSRISVPRAQGSFAAGCADALPQALMRSCRDLALSCTSSSRDFGR